MNTNLNDLISQAKEEIIFKTAEKLPTSRGSGEILNFFYSNLFGPYTKELKDSDNGQVKRPVLVSFHPKLSLLNNNIHECLLAVKLAEVFNLTPVWIPYVYDTATHALAEGGKIRAPTYAYVENKFHPIRTASQIHGNIIKTEKSIQKKEINKFIQGLKQHMNHVLGNFRNHLNQYDFGHYLFPLKLKIMKVNKKSINEAIKPIEDILMKTINRTDVNSLGEFLGHVTVELLHELGIPMNLGFIESNMAPIVKKVLDQVIETEQVKEDPSLLEGLFVHYDFKEKVRTPIQYMGNGQFIAFDDNSNRLFDGDIDLLCTALEANPPYVLPTGPSLILLFMAIGTKYTLGGLHTQEYYPEYIEQAQTLLKGTDFNTDMSVIGYGEIRSIDNRNMTDILAVSRILEKIGSRTIAKNGHISIPSDIIDQVNFLGGLDAVPLEYQKILEELLVNSKKNTLTALQKEIPKLKKIRKWLQLSDEELKEEENIMEIQPFFRKMKLGDVHPERIKIAIETLVDDSEMRVNKLKENLLYDWNIIGGTIKRNINFEKDNVDSDQTEIVKFNDDEKDENDPSSMFGSTMLMDDEDHLREYEQLFNGLLFRSKRVPSLMELIIYNASIDNEFETPLYFHKSDIPGCYDALILPHKLENLHEKSHEFSSFNDAISFLLPKKYRSKKFF